MNNKFAIVAIVLGLFFWMVILFLSSNKKEIVPKEFRARSDHEAYWHSLEQANLSTTALGRDWIHYSKECLIAASSYVSPFEAVFYFDPGKAGARAYRFSVKRGQKMEIFIDRETGDSLKLFVDLFRVDKSDSKDYHHVATSNRTFDIFFEPRRESDYILRIQPELLRGGRFRLSVRQAPSLNFPVEGKDKDAIHSFFGDPRDGGRRKHHGVDIFAKRHTPIIAPADGYVRFSGKRGLGGNVIWMRDSQRDQTLYFAHLQDIFVESGSLVKSGDTIGTVGNSGNAKTTPPHLHFGIYQRGPVNPYYFISDMNKSLKAIRGDSELVGGMVRTIGNAEIKLAGSGSKKLLLGRHQLIKAIELSGSNYLVELPDGTSGHIFHDLIESAAEPVVRHELEEDSQLLSNPTERDYDPYDMVYCGNFCDVLGVNEDLWYIKSEDGQVGWILAP